MDFQSHFASKNVCLLWLYKAINWDFIEKRVSRYVVSFDASEAAKIEGRIGARITKGNRKLSFSNCPQAAVQKQSAFNAGKVWLSSALTALAKRGWALGLSFSLLINRLCIVSLLKNH
ncbi:MAG TPA: hypothetical protein VGB45_03010 [Abditibacterium sp.]